jgi:hypothetical protein
MVEPIKHYFGLTDRQAGRINTAFMIGYFFTAPVFGYLGYRATCKWKTRSRAAGCPGASI